MMLRLSTSSLRTSPKTLEGLRVGVPACVFVDAEVGITKVTFTLDGKPVRTETAAPWDFAGTVAATGRAYAYDFTKLLNGQHVITADVYKGTAKTTLKATFTVVNGVPVPTPPPPPEPVVVATVTSPHTVTATPAIQDFQYVAAHS